MKQIHLRDRLLSGTNVLRQLMFLFMVVHSIMVQQMHIKLVRLTILLQTLLLQLQTILALDSCTFLLRIYKYKQKRREEYSTT